MIHIARAGQIFSQVTREEAEAGLKSGELLESDYYWQEGMAAWRPLPLLFAAKVALPFVRPAPAGPSLLDRMLRRLSESECLARYWDLLAVAPDHGAVAAADLEALDAACGCRVRSRCADALRRWYDAYVAMVMSDATVTGDERAMLTRVAAAFGIPADRAQAALAAAARAHYETQLPLLLRTDQPAEATVAAIRRIEAALGLPEAELAPVRDRELEAYFRFLIGDGPGVSVAPLTAKAIRAQAAAFGFQLGAHGDLLAQLALGERHWEAEHAPLPVVDVDILLMRDEVCHWSGKCGLSQIKRVTVGVSYSGPVASIRIMKGLSWRMASYRGQRETEVQLVPVDEGTVYITNRRIVFDGTLKNLVIKLERVIDFHGYKDAIRVEQATGVSPYFMIQGDIVIPFRILTRVCKAAQG